MLSENSFLRRRNVRRRGLQCSCGLLSLVILVFCVLFIYSAAKKNDPPVEATVEQGKLSGSWYVSRNGTKYHGFLGIPFAKPPIGALRFEPPQQPDSWEGFRDATKVPQRCAQKWVRVSDLGSEDCLYLNIFTPAERTGLLPVMVYIHGGGFMTGDTSSYSPVYFMDYPIVMVGIQYRLGILGFLSTGDEVVPGNNGMKDQVAALKWVQKNIANFGGDPNRVTIFGESAGAASVHFHLYSDLSKGLFQQAICQSGTGLAPWSTAPRWLARERALAVGVLNGCSTRDTKHMVDCLKNVPPDDIVQSLDKFHIWKFEPLVPFPIVAELDFVENVAFLTENPWRKEVVNNVPLIAGVNSGDGCLNAMRYLDGNSELAITLNAVYKRLFPIIFSYGVWLEDEKKVSAITEAMKTYYFKDKPIGPDTAHALVDMFTDGLFAFDSIEAAHRQNAPVYFYYYDHRNKASFKELFGNFDIDLGACHADDLLSFFNVSFMPDALNEDDVVLSKRLVKYWVNFATRGNPNGQGGTWTPVGYLNDFEYLHIRTKQDIMREKLLKERYELWDGFQIGPNHKPEN